MTIGELFWILIVNVFMKRIVNTLTAGKLFWISMTVFDSMTVGEFFWLMIAVMGIGGAFSITIGIREIRRLDKDMKEQK